MHAYDGLSKAFTYLIWCVQPAAVRRCHLLYRYCCGFCLDSILVLEKVSGVLLIAWWCENWLATVSIWTLRSTGICWDVASLLAGASIQLLVFRHAGKLDV